MEGQKVVVIEDETDIRTVIEHNLARAGFAVVARADGRSGLEAVRQERPALVVLDLMLPGLDGLEVCRLLRSDPGTAGIPIVMVTARDEEQDIVLGLELGADDYLTKPFRPRELVARVRAVIRRHRPDREPDRSHPIMVDGVVIDESGHTVLVDGAAVSFTATEFRLLHVLASNPGRVFTRDHLLDRVMGRDTNVIDRNIDVHIGTIRQKLARHRDRIETVRRVGYRFRGDTEPR